LLPQIVRRVEDALSAHIYEKHADEVYLTLTVYLMLDDAARHDAKAVKDWVIREWERSDFAAEMGGRYLMSRQMDALFVYAL
ncbi:ImcF-related family protein, partial [Burkholderia pseudomallei]